MNEGYFIVYDDCGSECEECHFKIVGGFDTISAISNFYGELSERYSTVDIDDELFYKLIKNLTVEEAVKLHNLLVPGKSIAHIYEVHRKLFDENDMEVVKEEK